MVENDQTEFASNVKTEADEDFETIQTADAIGAVAPASPVILAATPITIHVVLAPLGNFAELQPLEVECQVKSAILGIFSAAWPLKGTTFDAPTPASGSLEVGAIVDTQICAEPAVFAPGIVQMVSSSTGDLVYEVQVFSQDATDVAAVEDSSGPLAPVTRHVTASEVRPLSRDTIFSYGIRTITGLTPDTVYNLRSTRKTTSEAACVSPVIAHKTKALSVPSTPAMPELVHVDDTSAKFLVSFSSEGSIGCKATSFDLDWCMDYVWSRWTRQQQSLDQNADTTVTAMISGLTPSSKHLVRVRGRSGDDAVGEWSPQLPFTTKAKSTKSSSVSLTLKSITSCDVVIEGTVPTPTPVADASAPIDGTAESSAAQPMTASPSQSLKLQLKPKMEFKWKPKASSSFLDLRNKSSRLTCEIRPSSESSLGVSLFTTVGLTPATTYVMQARKLTSGSSSTEPWCEAFEFRTLGDTEAAATASAVTASPRAAGGSDDGEHETSKGATAQSVSSASPKAKASSWASYIILYNSTDATIKVS